MAASITFQIIDGVDKGRVFRNLVAPITIGREEGNVLRLNDERISRFHAKVQQDQGDLILTDLESTNGTRVNGNVIQIHRLRVGDCVSIGRSVLLFGSNDEIAARMNRTHKARGQDQLPPAQSRRHHEPTLLQEEESMAGDDDLTFNMSDEVQVTESGLFIGEREFPPLPLNLSPSQSARIAEIFDRLHRGLAQILERIKANQDGSDVRIDGLNWQNILAVEMLLARYHRAITDPDSWNQA